MLFGGPRSADGAGKRGPGALVGPPTAYQYTVT